MLMVNASISCPLQLYCEKEKLSDDQFLVTCKYLSLSQY